MPRIFDNINLPLLPTLQDTLKVSNRVDFCVGYLNLRGWRKLDSQIEAWSGGPENCCRLLVGMQKAPEEQLRAALSIAGGEEGIDTQTAQRLRRKLAKELEEQLTLGFQSNEDEAGLRRLASQIRAKKIVVKLFLRHQLHAKLYLMFRTDHVNPIVGYLGSSNLTLSGLRNQGELNVDVLDHDAASKLAKWFEDRWEDRFCIDISDELVRIIEDSWAREKLIPPYHIYIKMAYHLSHEARAGLAEFSIPKEFGNELFDYQVAAVKIAAHHLRDDRRRGVILGDVVGLGKTLMATALARIFEEAPYDLETLIICPKNLVAMWEDYKDRYRMRGKVLSVTRAEKDLTNLRRYRLLILDESHNLRNREGRRYQAIRDYISKNECRCILLSATPYNKAYLDLGAQLRLFVPETVDLGVRPELLIRQIGGEARFNAIHQCPPRSIAAFEKSEIPDDWRELMRLFMVRRTRGFIRENYAEPERGTGRKYLLFADGTRSYFPDRIPKTIRFESNPARPDDPYGRLFSPQVEALINSLHLPRYGLGNYEASMPDQPPTPAEAKILKDLGRAGKRLMGFCRTNLFKRLESSGLAFLQSVERHVLRNYIFIHAIENGLPVPIGTSDQAMLDADVYDQDADEPAAITNIFEDDPDEVGDDPAFTYRPLSNADAFAARAAEIYNVYAAKFKRRFRWLNPNLFTPALANHLKEDASILCDILRENGAWNADNDAKLAALMELVCSTHPAEKMIVFTQFADTVRYLAGELRARGVKDVQGVTGQSADPTKLAWRFSPNSNNKRDQVKTAEELRVLIATDVLSEGQNLQDAHVVVNFDLPWAIIRLIQRAGRVDRIGQQSEAIYCYTFYPMDGVDRIIKLRGRVRRRLKENSEVVGSDETFFEDEAQDRQFRDLYNEKAGILDGDAEGEVDLASHAYQIWKNAVDEDPSLKPAVEALPDVVYSARAHPAQPGRPNGALVYVRTAEGSDALAWVDERGEAVTQSQFAILKAAECEPPTPAIQRAENHHAIVRKGVERLVEEESRTGGQLGSSKGARYRVYERLMDYACLHKGTLLETPQLNAAIEDLYRYPLLESAIRLLNDRLRANIQNEQLVELVIALREDGRLCIIGEEAARVEPRIICSLGLV